MVTAIKPPAGSARRTAKKMAVFRNELKRGRSEAGLIQQDIADAIGRTQRYVSGVESGAITPRLNEVLIISELLRPALGRNILEVLNND